MKDRPGWTRAEPIETIREVVAAARTPGGKILCIAALQGGSAGSISRVTFNGTFLWLGARSGEQRELAYGRSTRSRRNNDAGASDLTRSPHRSEGAGVTR